MGELELEVHFRSFTAHPLYKTCIDWPSPDTCPILSSPAKNFLASAVILEISANNPFKVVLRSPIATYRPALRSQTLGCPSRERAALFGRKLNSFRC
jgi:hypothetical protein